MRYWSNIYIYAWYKDIRQCEFFIWVNAHFAYCLMQRDLSECRRRSACTCTCIYIYIYIYTHVYVYHIVWCVCGIHSYHIVIWMHQTMWYSSNTYARYECIRQCDQSGCRRHCAHRCIVLGYLHMCILWVLKSSLCVVHIRAHLEEFKSPTACLTWTCYIRWYGVATIRRLLKTKGLFCQRAL